MPSCRTAVDPVGAAVEFLRARHEALSGAA